MDTVIENEKETPTAKGKPKLYEAMFLIDSGEAATDWDGINATIKNILEKAGAEIVSMRKWDERKLAYTINGKGKGTYILCYFKAEGGKLQGIERDIQLSERIMRALILCAEDRPVEEIDKVATSQTAGETETPKPTDEKQGKEDEEQEQPKAEDSEQAN
ncbi:MAG: 30S ribosomal protein S6 [Phycisphaerae bacterium]|nr:30S ribosomal protein S6 [Phycisphaerae bacterium]MDD5380455.1 30S ribosomal protein S6 [Phycisphaerae bacterium]